MIPPWYDHNSNNFVHFVLVLFYKAFLVMISDTYDIWKHFPYIPIRNCLRSKFGLKSIEMIRIIQWKWFRVKVLLRLITKMYYPIHGIRFYIQVWNIYSILLQSNFGGKCLTRINELVIRFSCIKWLHGIILRIANNWITVLVKIH